MHSLLQRCGNSQAIAVGAPVADVVTWSIRVVVGEDPRAGSAGSDFQEGSEMAVEAEELKFLATEEKGEVSALIARPPGAEAMLVLGHGAGTNMRHSFIQDLSDALNDADIATFRFNYPYSEKGGGMDGERVRLATVRAAVATALNRADGLPGLRRRALYERAHVFHGLRAGARWTG